MAHENELYVDAIDLIENRVSNDNQVPVIKNNKIKQLCIILFEFIKVVIYYIKYSINRNVKPKQKPKSKFRKQPIHEDFELSDDEPTTINLNEEQKLSSKCITFDCPLCVKQHFARQSCAN